MTSARHGPSEEKPGRRVPSGGGRPRRAREGESAAPRGTTGDDGRHHSG
ncbi:hypothetical protein [Nocardiopsis sp. NRRL B-16309]|nr:hypothetical protein [Nocardiopsis sp. NRRL B-16309]